MFLKKYLLAAFKEYWDLIKKREVLSGDISELIKKMKTEKDSFLYIKVIKTFQRTIHHFSHISP